MPRFDEMPEYRARLPKSTHDLSHKFGFTATVAHLLPVFHDFLNAGETVDLGFSFNLRTQPLTQAAMVDITAHVEYFFVPMFLLYEPFGSMYFDINDNYSTNYPSGGSLQVIQKDFPVIDFEGIRQGISLLGGNSNYFEPVANGAIRLMDHFGFNVKNWISSDTSTPTLGYWNPNVFPYQLLAYHCIYQYYYRLDTRERFNQGTFNFDSFYNTSVVSQSDLNANNGNTSVGFLNLFRIHYRPKDSDYFTDVKVSPIVDVLNLNVKNSLGVARNWLTRGSVNDYPVLKEGAVGNGSNGNVGNSPDLFSSIPSSVVTTQFGLSALPHGNLGGINDHNDIGINGQDINTANIRAMFATEKLWSITGRARKHYDDQTLAHFGFKVPHDVKHEISCFGHDRSKIHIGEVISTADTFVPGSSGSPATGTRIGDIAGKGYGSLSAKSHRFTAPCHGVVMAILSFTPELTYGNTFLKANSVASREDLYTPEYDHLGMQPLFGYEGTPENPSIRSSIIGWQYRYEQWKRRYNRVSNAFTSAGSLDSWMIDSKPSQVANVANSNTNIAPYLYDPSTLNQIMVVNYVTATPQEDSVTHTVDISSIYDGDPFVVDGYISCKKISTMSDYSLPRLDA